MRSIHTQRASSGGGRRGSILAPLASHLIRDVTPAVAGGAVSDADSVSQQAKGIPVSAREVLRRVLVRFAADFFEDLESLQQVRNLAHNTPDGGLYLYRLPHTFV